MFSDQEDKKEISGRISSTLANHSEFKSHSRHVNRENAKNIGLKIQDLEDDQTLQDLVLSIFHSTTHTFTGTSATKIIENHEGKSFIKQERQVIIQAPPQITPEPEDRQS